MNTFVYIDGFNLYYGAVKGTPYKWLNLAVLCNNLLPNFNIVTIKYYTAHVGGQPVRQQTYIRALRTLPNLEIIYGQFLQHKVRMRLANPPKRGKRVAEVIKTEEKGSDVNIAAHMIHDGHLGRYDVAVLVSNDSDLAEPVRIVRHELNKTVCMLNPHKHPSYELNKHVMFMKPIRKGVLGASQFPQTMHDADGSFHKPEEW